MNNILRLAWRNLGRNRRRTVVTAVALGLGLGLSVASFGLVEGISANMMSALTRYDLGHLQIHRTGYRETRRPADVIEGAPALAESVRQTAGVTGSSARLYGHVLASRSRRSIAVEVLGIDPPQEARVTRIADTLLSGAFLPATPTPWPRGRRLDAAESELDQRLTAQARSAAVAEIEALAGTPGGRPVVSGPDLDAQALTLARAQRPPPDRPIPVLIGEAAASSVEARVGEILHLSTSGLDRTTHDVAAVVIGVFRTGTGALDRRLYLHLTDMERLLGAEGRAHEVAVAVADPGAAAALATLLSGRLEGRPLEVRAWAALRPDVAQLLELGRGSGMFMVLIILLAASLGVLNTMLMAVSERTREIGVLKAIGMAPRRIVLMILSETLLLATVAIAAGVMVGLAINTFMVLHGIDLSRFTRGVSMAGVGVPPVFRSEMTADGFIVPVVILAVISVLVAIFPAWRAGRLPPAVGMRDV